MPNIYKAGENIKLNFKYEQFKKTNNQNSKVKLIMINNENELKKYVTQNIYGKNIVIVHGRWLISQWMRNLPNKCDEISRYQNFYKKILKQISIFDHSLNKINWFNIGGKSKIFFKPESLNELISFLKLYKKRGKIFQSVQVQIF